MGVKQLGSTHLVANSTSGSIVNDEKTAYRGQLWPTNIHETSLDTTDTGRSCTSYNISSGLLTPDHTDSTTVKVPPMKRLAGVVIVSLAMIACEDRAPVASPSFGAGDLIETTFTDLQRLEIYLKDDSPEDGRSGGALFAFNLLIHDLQGNETRYTGVDIYPFVEGAFFLQGGFQRAGYRSADGVEEIYLLFDFEDENYTGPEPSEISRLIVEMTVANDYYIEVLLNGIPKWNVSALGNTKDLSNKTVVRVEVDEKEQNTSIEAVSWARIKNALAGFFVQKGNCG